MIASDRRTVPEPTHCAQPPIVAYIGAAVPQIEDTLLSDDAIGFLPRCSRCGIDRLTPQATRRAIAEPISEHDCSTERPADHLQNTLPVRIDDSRTVIPIDQPKTLTEHLRTFLTAHT